MMNPLRRIFNVLLGPRAREREHDPEDSVTVGHPDNEVEAELWRSILDERGIPSAVIGPTRLNMYGMIDRGIRLEVLYRNVDDAREILALGADGRPLDEPGLAPVEREEAPPDDGAA